ncbi:MAG: hypothetical protein LBK61_07125 [Spirochaetaceae bacterium]|jgi:hypothetical protein|nr:hypothetical protein [Spirochaetaceae bacterium]
MSDFLFARPSIVEGIGRNVDLFGVMNTYNYPEDEAEVDAWAFVADVAALRNDFDSIWPNLIGDQK